MPDTALPSGSARAARDMEPEDRELLHIRLAVFRRPRRVRSANRMVGSRTRRARAGGTPRRRRGLGPGRIGTGGGPGPPGTKVTDGD